MTDGRAETISHGPSNNMRARLRQMSVWFQKVLTPGLENSQYAYCEVLSQLVRTDVDWLDLGCGHQLLPDWMSGWEQQEAAITGSARSVTGIDLDQSAIRRHRHIARRVVGDLHRLPFQDGCFDLITANVVLEHIAEPSLLLGEAWRVLRPGGLFLFHTPNLHSYGTLLAVLLPQPLKNKLALLLQGRREEDVYPTFYRINTRRKIEDHTRRSGFSLVDLRMVESSAQTYMLGPLVLLELLLIRMLRWRFCENYRTNVIAILKKHHTSGF